MGMQSDNRLRVSRMRCSAKRCTADQGPPRTGTVHASRVHPTCAHWAPISGKPEIGVCKKNRKKQGSDQPARRSRRCFGSLILREAPSRRMRRAIPLPSCFETDRSAVRQWNDLRSRRAALLFGMRARRRCAFWPNEPNCDFGQTKPTIMSAKPNACLSRAKDNLPLYGMTAGSVPVFPHCYLQWVLQLARVGL
jgi:hypothetical protein